MVDIQIGTFFSISQHTAFFLLSVVFGAGMGVVYDCFRMFRIIFPPAAKGWALTAQDILFWAIYGFGIFCYSTAVCGGELRFFMLLGSLLGLTLYILTVGNLVTGILRKIFTAFYGGLRKVYSVLFEPIVKIFKKFCQKLCPVFVRNHKNKEKSERSVKKLLKNSRELVYNKKAELGRSILKRGR